jgi:hypothetical protein
MPLLPSGVKSNFNFMSKTEFANSEKMQINTGQEIYDAFNNLIFSNDTKVLGKLLARALLAEKTREVPGDIVECGVFKGSGLASWLKIKKLLFPNSMKKVIGFDFFDTKGLVGSLSGIDKQRMKELFEDRNFNHKKGGEELVQKILENAGFGLADFELVSGDISKSAPQFAKKRPGFKISLLYLDLDLGKPTFDTLKAFWPRVSRGGLVVFDEYALHQWSESQGVDQFFAEMNVKVKILDFMAPTAYVIKE